jgi:Flp pilus assembly protein TadD/uncharacterized protein (AIM24 family)
VARVGGGPDDIEVLDEEFLFHLTRGSELLTRGEAEPARASLERARLLRPKDAKVLGLLGQAYYRLSRFDDAAAIWQRLVDDNPVEPAARVNLGLALLKAKRHPESAKQLEIALDLNPDHKKAMGYLGLALLESGQASKAREWFVRAGSDQMVARCDEVLSGRGPAPGAAEAAAEPEPAEASPPVEPTDAPEPIGTPLPGAMAAARPAALTVGAPALAEWAAARRVRATTGDAVFALDGDVLVATVQGELRVRLEGLFGIRGKVEFAGEVKRFRGRETDQPFGEGAARMQRASGDGVLLLRAAGRRLSALDLGADAAYLREEAVYGFGDGIAFENGRVPSSAAELNLVHLRGRGPLLLATAGEPVAVDVSPDAPLRIPLRALVGWIGALTPRVTSLVEERGDAAAAVELTGEGRALVDPQAIAAREATP